MATGGANGAGIGGGRNRAGGTVIISGSANVTATGGQGGAGIGGGWNGAGGTVTISGSAEVTATGGTDAAGIGGGDAGAGGTGVITGGNILSINGSGATSTQEMDIYADPGHSTQVYQNILTVDQLTTTGVIPSITTSDGVLYSLNGAKTISYSGAEVVSVWLKDTTSNESINVMVNGDLYQCNYTRAAGINNEILYYLRTPVTGITLDKIPLSLLPNLNESLMETVQPSNATDKNVTWNSSDVNIATVDASGVVTGKNVGTATTTDGGYSASCTVTLATSNYTVTSGSTVITLKNSWLTAQSNGTYAIITNFTNGQAGVTLTINQSSTSSGSSSSPSSDTGGTTVTGGNAGGTNTSKDFWYPNSSGSTSSASSNTSANSGNATSPDSPNYNPATGGDVGGVSTLMGFFLLAAMGSVGVYTSKRKR